MEMFLNAYGPDEIGKVIGLIENNLDSRWLAWMNAILLREPACWRSRGLKQPGGVWKNAIASKPAPT
ncbi:hypothetical protein, partial [Pseudomonas asplenii]|uniref:hypothetical protein n=1 Tax=Pseudomonas asplenii TaxID=53407 RepID=UPI001E2E0555